MTPTPPSVTKGFCFFALICLHLPNAEFLFHLFRRRRIRVEYEYLVLRRIVNGHHFHGATFAIETTAVALRQLPQTVNSDAEERRSLVDDQIESSRWHLEHCRRCCAYPDGRIPFNSRALRLSDPGSSQPCLSSGLIEFSTE